MRKSEHGNRGKEKKSDLDALEETLNLIKINKGKGELRRLLKISPTALSNRLKRLEKLGVINLVGKYEMQITGSSLKHPKVTRTLIDKKLNKRGHAYGTSIVFSQSNDLWNNKKVVKELKQKRIKRLGYGSYRLNYKGFTVIINKEDFTVYAKKGNSLFSKDALKSRFFALNDLDNLAKYLKGRYDLKGIYGLGIFREHYGIIFNQFAKWLLSKGRKMEVKDKGNKAIIWVDDSKEDDIGLKELEGVDAMKMNTADKFFDSKDKTGWNDDTPQVEENKKDIDKLVDAQVEGSRQLLAYADQNKEHLALIQDYRQESQENRRESQQDRKLIHALLKKLDEKL